MTYEKLNKKQPIKLGHRIHATRNPPKICVFTYIFNKFNIHLRGPCNLNSIIQFWAYKDAGTFGICMHVYMNGCLYFYISGFSSGTIVD